MGWSFHHAQGLSVSTFTTLAANFLAPLPGTKKEYFQRLKKTSHVNLAPALASTPQKASKGSKIHKHPFA
jgi:hypothetical protein